jgi:DNA-binding LacI/PurR family transcriptional regulator/DNA-binding transcriptional regulator YhcF (GntR family)
MAGPEAHGSRVDLAVRFLNQRIKSSVEKGTERLPPVALLASDAGVSSVTLSKAVSRLVHQGVLTARQKSGIHLIGTAINAGFELSSAMAVGRHRRRPAWESVHGRIGKDLLSGRFGSSGALPPLKELCDYYGTTYPTLKRALETLVADNRLVPFKRGYRPFLPLPSRKPTRLVVVVPSTDDVLLARTSPRAAEFWRTLETECVRMGLAVDVIDYLAAGREAKPIGRGKTQHAAQGYLLMTQTAPFDELHSVVGALASTLRPVAVFDEVGKATIPSLVTTTPRMHLFVLSAGERPGYDLGTYLVGKGHRRVAFFGAFKNDPWSLNRYRGLCNAFDRAGLADTVVSYAVDHYEEWAKIYQPSPGHEPFDRLNPLFHGLQASWGYRAARNDPAFFIHSQDFLWSLKARETLEPAFREALARSTATAWVAENDAAAIFALSYLRGRKKQVPEEIAVAGFDNTVESFCSGLTTIDFNVGAVVRAMIGHIVTARSWRPPRNSGPVEIPGIIMERASTSTPFPNPRRTKERLRR